MNQRANFLNTVKLRKFKRISKCQRIRNIGTYFSYQKIALFYKRTFLLLPNKVSYKRIIYHCYMNI